MKHCLVISTLIAVVTAQGVLPPVIGSDTLYREQVPERPATSKPSVANPAEYDVYFDPAYNAPLVAAPILKTEPEPQRPKYTQKPFVPRERKQVEKLVPAGPVLYSAPEENYQSRAVAAPQDLSGIPGYPGKDYPLFAVVPKTGFSCDQVPYRPGLYADVESGCQAYHICEADNRHGYSGADFLCTNGTIFNQYELTCDWWYNVDCSLAAKQYDVNLDPYKNPYLATPEEEAARAASLAEGAKYGQQPPKEGQQRPGFTYGPGFGSF